LAVPAGALLSQSFDDEGGVEGLAAEGWPRHYDRVFRYVRRRTTSRAEAEDLTQEVFADAAAALARWLSPASARLWPGFTPSDGGPAAATTTREFLLVRGWRIAVVDPEPAGGGVGCDAGRVHSFWQRD
jgi:hypothetical protein